MRWASRLRLALGVGLALLPFATGAAAVNYPNPAAIAISDCCAATPAASYPIAIPVSLAGSISEVTVTLNGLTHGDTADLDVLLGGANNDYAAVVSFIQGQNTVTAGNGARRIPFRPVVASLVAPRAPSHPE